MTIFLIRHGQKVPEFGDPALTELGKEQAAKTAAFLSEKPLTVVAASPLRRAQETAGIIAQPHNLSVVTTSLLLERMNWGDQPNQNLTDFIQLWRDTSNNRELQPPTGFSSRQAGERLAAYIESLATEKVRAAALISHGGVITDFLRNLFGDEYLIDHYFKHYELLRDTEIPECSITEFEINGQELTLKNLFSTRHLGS